MEKQTILDRLESFNEQLNLTHYWIILLKYKRIIFFLPIFIALLGYLMALNIQPIFMSSATLVIEKQQKKIVDIEEVYSAQTTGFGTSYNHINNQIQIIKSDEVISSILLDEQTVKVISELYIKIPDRFVSRNIKAFKKFLFRKVPGFNIDNKNFINKENIKKYIKSNLAVNHIRNSDVVDFHSDQATQNLLNSH